MSFCRRYTVSITTDASGDATAYTSGSYGDSHPPNGRILSILYDGGMDTGADVTCTTETTGQSVWTESNLGTSAIRRAPRQVTHGVDGTELLYAAAGQNVEDYIWASDERIKFVIAQGGNAQTGVFTVIVG